MHFTFVVYSTSTFSPSLGTVAELLPPHTIGTNCGHLSFALRVMHSCVIHEQSAQMSFSSFLSSFFSFVFSFSLSLLFSFSFSFSFSFLSFLLSLTFQALDLHWQVTLQAKDVLALKGFWAASPTFLGSCFQDRHLGVFGLLFLLLGVFGHLLTICCSCQLHSPSFDKRNGIWKKCLGFCPWFFWQLQLPLASFLQEPHSSPPAWCSKCTHTDRLSRSTRNSPKLQCPNAK